MSLPPASAIALPAAAIARTAPGQVLAAVDLGSNSFHLLLAKVVGDSWQVLDRLKEPVRLAGGLGQDLRMDDASMQRGWRCLERFGQRLRDLPPGTVRAVGTSTLRRAANAGRFLETARQALGHPIEIISGREEARLIYLGVAHGAKEQAGHRLVIDIGGGSTECIVGERFVPIWAESLEMGCVGFTQRFFGSGSLARPAWRAASMAAQQEIEPVFKRLRDLGWKQCLGSSGTICAIEDILREWTGATAITLNGLEKLQKAMIEAGLVANLQLPALKSDRAAVLPGGVAVLLGLFTALQISEMSASSFALREGLLHDLLGRQRHADTRDHTVAQLGQRFAVDKEQADRVQATVLGLLAQTAPWKLREDAGHWLTWAAQLHELGLQVSYNGYHKHGAYLIENADLPGFSRDDQETLAHLVRLQRRKFAPSNRPESLLRLAILLRLAVVLHRSRSDRPLPELTLAVGPRQATLSLPSQWLDEHPLTEADLQAEAGELGDGGFTLDIARLALGQTPAAAAATGRQAKNAKGSKNKSP